MKLKESIVELAVEFRTFVLKGNVLDLAVGVIIGAGFKTLVDSMVNDVITPIVKWLSHKRLEMNHSYLGDVMSGFGSFGGAILNFLLLAAIIFLVFVKPMNKLKALIAGDQGGPPPPQPDDVRLLTEIRDLLKEKSSSASEATKTDKLPQN